MESNGAKVGDPVITNQGIRGIIGSIDETETPNVLVDFDQESNDWLYWSNLEHDPDGREYWENIRKVSDRNNAVCNAAPDLLKLVNFAFETLNIDTSENAERWRMIARGVLDKWGL